MGSLKTASEIGKRECGVALGRGKPFPSRFSSFYLSSPSIPFFLFSPHFLHLPFLIPLILLKGEGICLILLCQWQERCSFLHLYPVHLYPPPQPPLFPISILFILTPQIPQLVLIQRVRLDRFLGEEWDGESWSHSIVCSGRGERSPEDTWSGQLFVHKVYKFSAYKLLVHENQRIVNFPNCPSRFSCFSFLVFLSLFGIHKCN